MSVARFWLWVYNKAIELALPARIRAYILKKALYSYTGEPTYSPNKEMKAYIDAQIRRHYNKTYHNFYH